MFAGARMEIVVTRDMHGRKRLMFERAIAFVRMGPAASAPRGTGRAAEPGRNSDAHNKPDPDRQHQTASGTRLLELLDHMTRRGVVIHSETGDRIQRWSIACKTSRRSRLRLRWPGAKKAVSPEIETDVRPGAPRSGMELKLNH